MLQEKKIRKRVNPVRNSGGALNPAGIVLKCNPAAEQRSIISNGVKPHGTSTCFGVGNPPKHNSLHS